MINNINADGLIGNAKLGQNQETSGVDSISKNMLSAYGKNVAFIDESSISQEALALYEKEQEINRYKGFLNSISEEDANKEVASLIENGILTISDEELVNSMFNNEELMKELF